MRSTRAAGGPWLLLGPAFVAAMAYVDPGNVAANISAGAEYGYLLLWVLVASSAMAMLVQYLSAKLGVVTGSSLAELVANSLSRRPRLKGVYAAQAVAVAIATDLAEVVGGAIALYLLFGLPLWLGAILVGGASIFALHLFRSRGESVFSAIISALLAVIAVGFLASLWWMPPDPAGMLGGLAPRFDGAGSIHLAAAMLGATVMPHAIYLHSALARDRYRGSEVPVRRLLKVQRLDVMLALVVAGSVNIAMLLFAAAGLRGSTVDTIEAAHAEIQTLVGDLPATVFAVGLLASGFGSAIVGTDAGAGMVRSLISPRISPVLARAATLVPAVAILALGMAPTAALVQSQLVLSFGIAFALVPLARYTSARAHMGEHANPAWLTALSWVVVAAVIALNLAVLLA